MTSSPTKLHFESRPWHVPNVERALEGGLEGRPTEAMRNLAIENARRERAEWQPDAEAWTQLIQLHAFIGKRVRIQFFDPGTMYLLNEDEWPHPVEADCVGVVTVADDGRPQPFLLLRTAMEVKTGGCSGLCHLVERPGFVDMLAPVAELYEIESLGEVL